MRVFTAVIERCPDTGLFVGYFPGFPGAHSQGETIDELQNQSIRGDRDVVRRRRTLLTNPNYEQEERELTETKKNGAISVVLIL